MVLKEGRQKEREIAVGATALSKCSLAGPLPKLTSMVAETSLVQTPSRICLF